MLKLDNFLNEGVCQNDGRLRFSYCFEQTNMSIISCTWT